MKKRSAIVISATMVAALMAGVVGANRAVLQQSRGAPVVVVHRQAAPSPAPPAPGPIERE